MTLIHDIKLFFEQGDIKMGLAHSINITEARVSQIMAVTSFCG